MAKRNYKTYGSVAYAPDKIDAPRKARQPQSPGHARPERRPTQRPLTRKRVEVREAGAISLDAIVGFLCAGALAAMVMNGYAQLTTSSDQVVQLRQELQKLEAEKQLLSAQYEKHFDIQRIEETLGNEMMRPTSDQVVYIDLSQPDVVTVFGKDEDTSVSFWDAFKNILPKK